MRDIPYIEIDARKILTDKGVKPATLENPIKIQRAQKKKDDS